MTAPRRLCVVPRCDHAHDTDWLHIPDRRQVPLVVHLQHRRRAAA